MDTGYGRAPNNNVQLVVQLVHHQRTNICSRTATASLPFRPNSQSYPDCRTPCCCFYSRLLGYKRGMELGRHLGYFSTVFGAMTSEKSGNPVSRGVGPPFRRVRHFQPFPAVTTYGYRDTVRIRVRVSRLVVGISKTIPCNDHEWRLSEWRTFRNGGQEPLASVNSGHTQGRFWH